MTSNQADPGPAQRHIEKARKALLAFLPNRYVTLVRVKMLAAQFAEVERERDAAWAATIDPQNVGTDYGNLLAQGPEMAAGLLTEGRKLREATEKS